MELKKIKKSFKSYRLKLKICTEVFFILVILNPSCRKLELNSCQKQEEAFFLKQNIQRKEGQTNRNKGNRNLLRLVGQPPESTKGSEGHIASANSALSWCPVKICKQILTLSHYLKEYKVGKLNMLFRKLTKSGRELFTPKVAWRLGWDSTSQIRTWFQNFPRSPFSVETKYW